MMPSAAPDFSLKAVTSGRIINRAHCTGRPLVLLFHNQDGLAEVRALQTAVRTRWPNPSLLLVGSVVNLQAVPRLLRGVAESMLGMAFREAAREVPAGLDPGEYVLILPDRSGQVCYALGVHDGGKTPTVLIIDGAWQLCGRFAGAEMVAQTVAALDALLAHA